MLFLNVNTMDVQLTTVFWTLKNKLRFAVLPANKITNFFFDMEAIGYLWFNWRMFYIYIASASYVSFERQ